MNTKKQKNKTKVKVFPEWKYKMLLARIDRQDKVISRLSKDVLDLDKVISKFLNDVN